MSQRPSNRKARVYMLAESAEDIRTEPFGDSVDLTAEYGDLMPDGQLSSADVISLYVRNEKWGEDTARFIRARPEFFLKPLVILSEYRLEALNGIVDDEIILPVAGDTLGPRLDRLLSISRKIEGLTTISEGSSSEKFNEILVLRYLFTRKGFLLKPARNLSSHTGYSYSPVQLLIDGAPGEELDLLEGLENVFLLKGKMVDKVHLCPFCGHFQINFRETCPGCRSIRINEERTLHHFRCAYVGKEDDFRQGSQLRCPKCGREIRHIGVDYDRPATNLWCEECNGNFAEPLVTCFCMNCAKSFPPEYALPKPVKVYSLTREGEEAAREGILPETSLAEFLKKTFGFYKIEVFKEFLRLEIERCNRNNFDSTLGRVAIKNLPDAGDEGGIVRAQKLKEEVAVLFKEMLRESDILTDIGNDEILVILTHTDTNQANIAINRIREKSKHHFKVKIDFEYRFLALRGQSAEVEQILDSI